MGILTKKERVQDCLKASNDACAMGMQYLTSTGLMDDWRDALLTYLSQGDLTNPKGFNVKVNRIMSDLMTLVPRYTKYLAGTEPFFPLAPRNKNDRAAKMAARNWEDVVRDKTPAKSFYPAFNDVTTFFTLYGTAGLEARMDLDVVSVMEQRPIIDKSTNAIIGYEDVPADVVKRDFRDVARAPWEMLFHPHGNTHNEKPWSILKDLVHVDEIRRLIDMKVFELPPGYTDEDLKKAPKEWGSGYEEPEKQWRRDKSVFHMAASEDLGTFLRYFENPSREYPRGRWVYSWNYGVPLFKEGFVENRLMYLSNKAKPFTVFRDVSPPRPDRFYGSGIYRVIKDLIKHRDDLLSAILDRLYMMSYGWWLYDQNALSPEDMEAATYGARVSVKSTYDKKLSDAIHPVPGSDPPQSIFQFQQFLDQIADDRQGLHPPITGETPARKEAATTNSILASAGNARLDGFLRLVEMSSMAEYGELKSCIIAQNATQQDIVAAIGMDRFMQAPVKSLHSIDGGYIWKFKGSTLVTEQAMKREAEKDMWSQIGGDPVVMRGDRSLVIRNIIGNSGAGYTDEEIERIAPSPEQPPVIAVEVQQQLQQQQQQNVPEGRVGTQEQNFGIVGAQRPGASNEQTARVLSQIMGQ